MSDEAASDPVTLNPLPGLWRSGGVAANGWLSLPDAFSAEIMARSGLDSLVIDLQHGLADVRDVYAMIQAIQLSPCVPLVRVPWNEPSVLMRVLDAGALGVIVPLVNDAEEAARAIAACRYPPRGSRSYGPTRASTVYGPSYAGRADGEVMVFVMIETAAGLDAVDEICAVEGLTGVYIGPADLGLALGLEPRTDQVHPLHVAAVDRVLAACKRAGRIAGLHTNDVAFAREAARRGFQLLTVAIDHSCLRSEAERRLRAFRGDA